MNNLSRRGFLKGLLATLGIAKIAPKILFQEPIPNSRFKVYHDPYIPTEGHKVGYRGQADLDAGLFYCPYVPLQIHIIESKII